MGLGNIRLVLSLLVLVAVPSVNSHYVAVAPKNLRPESDYRVLISVNDAQGDVHVQGQIVISYLREKQKEDQVLSQSDNIRNGETGELRFSIDSSVVDSRSITLRIEGSGGLTFNNETSIELESVARLTFIQTDKATYKANDVVRFRVFTTLPDLMPKKIPKTIRVKNPAGSALQKYNDDGSNVVFEGEYKVFSSPELGDYKIEVEYKDHIKEERSIKVDEYVPPKFEVEADVHPKFLVGEPEGSEVTVNKGSEVTVNVKATYTYGKPVRGKVVLASEDDNILAEKEMDGTRDIKVDLKEMKSLGRYQTEKTVYIYVNVTDETNSNASTTVSVKITKNKAKIEFDRTLSDQVYRVGPVKVVVKVTDPVGGLLADSVRGNLTLSANSGSNKLEKVLFLEEGRNGFYTWIVEDISYDVNSFYFQAQLTVEGQKDTLYSSLNVQKYQTVGTASMNAKWTSESHEMWGTAEFTVDLNSENDWRLDSFWYMIISRGSVFRKETMSENRNAVISITPDMCPVAEIIVFGMTSSSTPELIADRLKLELKGCLKKQVTTRSVPREETGQKVDVEVDVSWTDPNKQGPVGEHEVFLLGVDKSMVLLQEQNNDITPDRVEEELKKIEMGSAAEEEDHMFGRRRKRTVLPWPGSSTPVSTGALLKDVGLNVLADVDMKDVNPFGGPIVAFRADGEVPEDDMMAEADVAEEIGGRVTVPPKTVVRKDFPDTWIFESGMTNVDGGFSRQKKLPDSITSWVISAFAIKDDGEIAVTKDPFEINVYNPFFVTMTLPYSICRTEIFVLRCTVFSYEDFDRDTVVTLMETKDFDIIGKSTWRERVVKNTAKSVEFKIKATTVKTINITVSATGRPMGSNAPDYTDMVTKTLIVKPEGEKHIRTENLPLSVEGNFIEKVVRMNFPPNTVDQSRKIVAKITGDMMGTVLNNIEDLIRKPYGCGEQNMITVVPNIAAMAYLTAVGANTREFSEKAIKYMEEGYQREQNYRWSNGGFSAFGTSDAEPSTWLSAFVLKSFCQASEFITVDRESLMETVAFLMGLEKEGRFTKLGRVIHDEMQGGTAAGNAFHVYVIMCLLEASQRGFEVSQDKLNLAFENALERASEELGSNPQKKHQFLAALLAYTLSLKEPNIPRVTDLLRYVEDSSPPWTETEEEEPERPEVDPYDYHRRYGPSAIEITSYCILAYVNIPDIRSALPLVMWLQKQQNDKGGFSTTQDTMVALQAIAAYAALSTSSANSVIHLYSLGKVDITKQVNENNRRILQIVELPSDITQLTVRATGDKSFTLVKIVWSFHTKPKDRQTRLDLTSRGTLIRRNVIEYMNCLMVHGGNDVNTNGMYVLSMMAPSGMEVDNFVETKQQNKHAKRIEQDKELLHIYLDEPSEKTCFTVIMKQVVKVENTQPGLAWGYSYYDSDEMYNSAELMPLADDGGSVSSPTGRATTLTSLSHLLLTAVICLLTSLVLAM